MHRALAERHFRRVHAHTTARRVRDLGEAMHHDKFWWVAPEHRDALWVVALTRARVRTPVGRLARATSLGSVVLSEKAAPFCRRGRVLLVRRIGTRFVASTVLTWSAFLKLMRQPAEPAVLLLGSADLPPFLAVRELSARARIDD